MTDLNPRFREGLLEEMLNRLAAKGSQLFNATTSDKARITLPIDQMKREMALSIDVAHDIAVDVVVTVLRALRLACPEVAPFIRQHLTHYADQLSSDRLSRRPASDDDAPQP